MLRTRKSALVASVFAGVTAFALIVSPAGAQTKSLPEAWFFQDRPAALKAIEGKPMPELKLKSWIGNQVSANDMKGKVVVIDFWATWCGPCVAAIPKNIELVNKYKSEGLVFIGVHDSNSGWDGAQAMVSDKKINYPVALDQDGGVSAKAVGLGFWPTYIVVDRSGVVRGAGMVPDQVGAAVKMLLAEPAPNMPSQAAKGEFPSEWFYGSANRSAAARALQGKPMPAIAVDKWHKDAPLTPADTKDRVVVVHFLASGNAVSMRQAEALAAVEKEMGPQGVVVLGIAPADDAWEGLTKLAEEGKLPTRLAQDAEVKEESPATDGRKSPPPIGATASAFGVRYLPATIVIDRAGKVRAIGVKPDKVKELASKLLAENTAKPADPSGGAADPGN